MKKFLIWFFIGSFLKGALMFLLILVDDSFEVTLLELCLDFIFFGLIDWILLNQLKPSFKRISWFRAILITFGTFSMILPITGTIFSIYNTIFSIPTTPDTPMSVSAAVSFLVLGFIISAISTLIWVQITNKLSGN